ncbi:MAG: flagellar protein FliT [Gammaproteobacteria bacterium]|nr:flagellar protein FliT [Gammaproteobacteria bacterium]
MNNEQRIAALNNIVSLTQEMLAFSQKEQWDEMIELDQQRKPLIAALFPVDEDGQTEVIRGLLQTLLELNKQLETVSLKARDDVRTQLQGLNKQRKVTSAYQSS